MKIFKKLGCLLLAAALFSIPAACGTEETVYTVIAPDGAPALSLVSAIAEKDERFSYRVIDASTIQAQVTGENPAADFCVLPVNLASKLLGKGERYRLLGTVTHGNLYFLTTGDNPVLTSGNIKTQLTGKTVGVVQLPNVPGLTLRATLTKYDAEYTVIDSIGADKAADKVNLLAIEAANVTPVYGCDYYLCPEPAASTKIKGTSGAFSLAGDLQALYGGEKGYPQAVLVAKNSALEDKSATEALISYFKNSAAYLASVQPAEVITLLDGVRTEGLSPAFNAKNLDATVIAHSAVSFTAAADCKAEINGFLSALIAVNASSASVVSEEFYYLG